MSRGVTNFGITSGVSVPPGIAARARRTKGPVGSSMVVPAAALSMSSSRLLIPLPVAPPRWDRLFLVMIFLLSVSVDGNARTIRYAGTRFNRRRIHLLSQSKNSREQFGRLGGSDKQSH